VSNDFITLRVCAIDFGQLKSMTNYNKFVVYNIDYLCSDYYDKQSLIDGRKIIVNQAEELSNYGGWCKVEEDQLLNVGSFVA